jgi:hypothetical protein
MAANYGIHDDNDDNYYHCSRNDCPCNDTGATYSDVDALFAALDSTCDGAGNCTADYSVDITGTCCNPTCYCDGFGCSCIECGCPTCWD